MFAFIFHQARIALRGSFTIACPVLSSDRLDDNDDDDDEKPIPCRSCPAAGSAHKGHPYKVEILLKLIPRKRVTPEG